MAEIPPPTPDNRPAPLPDHPPARCKRNCCSCCAQGQVDAKAPGGWRSEAKKYVFYSIIAFLVLVGGMVFAGNSLLTFILNYQTRQLFALGEAKHDLDEGIRIAGELKSRTDEIKSLENNLARLTSSPILKPPKLDEATNFLSSLESLMRTNAGASAALVNIEEFRNRVGSFEKAISEGDRTITIDLPTDQWGRLFIVHVEGDYYSSTVWILFAAIPTNVESRPNSVHGGTQVWNLLLFDQAGKFGWPKIDYLSENGRLAVTKDSWPPHAQISCRSFRLNP